MGKTKVGEKSECTSFNWRKFSTRAVVKVNKREAQCRKNQPKRLLSVKKLLPDDGHVVFFFSFFGGKWSQSFHWPGSQQNGMEIFWFASIRQRGLVSSSAHQRRYQSDSFSEKVTPRTIKTEPIPFKRHVEHFQQANPLAVAGHWLATDHVTLIKRISYEWMAVNEL